MFEANLTLLLYEILEKLVTCILDFKSLDKIFDVARFVVYLNLNWDWSCISHLKSKDKT